MRDLAALVEDAQARPGHGRRSTSASIRSAALPHTGGAPLPWPELSQRRGRYGKDFAEQGFPRPASRVADGRGVHEAGGSEAQELAFAIANGVAYLRALEAAGFALDEARRHDFLPLAADADEFLTIAKFRALAQTVGARRAACGLTPKPAFVAAETAWRMMTQRDPYVNMLRTTDRRHRRRPRRRRLHHRAAASPLALGLPDAFARRVARNTQLILLEESNLSQVADPAAGSGAIEELTAQALRRGLGACSRRSKRPAAPGRRSNTAWCRKKSPRCAPRARRPRAGARMR